MRSQRQPCWRNDGTADCNSLCLRGRLQNDPRMFGNNRLQFIVHTTTPRFTDNRPWNAKHVCVVYGPEASEYQHLREGDRVEIFGMVTDRRFRTTAPSAPGDLPHRIVEVLCRSIRLLSPVDQEHEDEPKPLQPQGADDNGIER